ncbi:thiaminase II [Paenibacillus silviterrae]|jgi:thiaminase (transcriptional activator TenA)|uniref:thiaminase II n=1 Tax=Paenibacillus silviterrae TaxID=3242194 RepID=UPI00254328E4|nr:thiaminase II [Paenibacillus chinjuensis]
MTSFTGQLRQDFDAIFEANYHHPFIRGVGRGELMADQLIHYVKQDYEYLNAYVRAYGLAVSKCSTREEMAYFQEKIGFILNDETHPHRNFCEAAGVSYEDLQGFRPAPAAHHYIRHMLTVAHEGTLGEIMCVLLPCPWIYWDIGERLVKEFNPQPDHPYYDWIQFYASERIASATQELCRRIDVWAEERATTAERERMREHFELSAQMEYMFWDMAYHVQDWPVKLK